MNDALVLAWGDMGYLMIHMLYYWPGVCTPSHCNSAMLPWVYSEQTNGLWIGGEGVVVRGEAAYQV